MSSNTFAPQAHINTQLTEADKIEAMDESGQSRLSQVAQCLQQITRHALSVSVWQQPYGFQRKEKDNH